MTTTATLKRTPFYDIHQKLGAKIVPFAGYEMPVKSPQGIT
jgi:aminomethyltransferase